MKTIHYFLFIILFSAFDSFAQQDTRLQTVELPDSNIRDYVVSPSLSATLIGKGQIEVNAFNTLSSQKIDIRNIDFQGDTSFTQSHISRLEHSLQLQYGFSLNNRINAGIDIYASHVRGDSDLEGSVWRVLGNKEGTGMSNHGISGMGPRIRWMPFKSLPEFSVQTSAVFGLGDWDTRKAFGRERTQLLAQFVFYQRFIERLYLFASVDASIFLRNKEVNNKTSFNFPLFLFGSYNLAGFGPDYPKIYGMASLSYIPKFIDTPAKGGWQGEGYDSFAGAGLLVQLSPQLGITLWGLKPLAYNLDLASTTILPGSWYTAALGIRYTYLPSSHLTTK